MPAAHGNLPAAGDTEGSRPVGSHPADTLPVGGQGSLPGSLPARTSLLSAALMPAGHSDADEHNAQDNLMVACQVISYVQHFEDICGQPELPEARMVT